VASHRLKYWILLIVMWPCSLASFFWAGYETGVRAGYGSDAEHDASLDKLYDCAVSLERCAGERQTLAVSCMEACSKCEGVADD
jgi:hypothetical protein